MTCLRRAARAAVVAMSLPWLGCAAQHGVVARPSWLDAPTITFAAGHKVMDVEAADLDGDGVQEVIVSQGGDQTKDAVAVYRLEGDRLDLVWRSRVEAHFQGMAIGDLDDDGKPELVVAELFADEGAKGTGAVHVFRSTCASKCAATTCIPLFEDSVAIPIVGAQPFDPELMDLDGDGDLDVLVGGMEPDGLAAPTPIVLTNRGDALEQPLGDFLADRPASWTWDLLIADLDDDGWLDEVFASKDLLVQYGVDPSVNGPRRTVRVDSHSSPCVRFVSSVGGSVVVHTAEIPHPRSSIDLLTNDTSALSHVLSFEDGMAGPVWLGRIDDDEWPDLLVTHLDYARRPIHYVRGGPHGFDRDERSRWTLVAQAMTVTSLDGRFACSRTESWVAARRRSVFTLRDRPIGPIVATVDGAERDFVTTPGARWLAFTPPIETGAKVQVTYRWSTAADVLIADGGGHHSVLLRSEDVPSRGAMRCRSCECFWI